MDNFVYPKNNLVLVKTLKKIRDETAKFLPIKNSFIKYDLLNLVMLHELENKTLNFKQLYSELKHSDIGIRNHLIQLHSDGWLSIEESKEDSRSKLITSTDRLHRCYERLSASLREES